MVDGVVNSAGVTGESRTFFFGVPMVFSWVSEYVPAR